MISLDGVSWYPCCVPEVERNELNRVSTHVAKRGKYLPKLGTHLQKISENQYLPARTPKNGEEFVRQT